MIKSASKAAGGLAILAILLVTATIAGASPPAAAEAEFVGPYPGTILWQTDFGYDELVGRVEKAIASNKMTLVAKASASDSALAEGTKIPGNAVLMVFRNDFSLRLLKASTAAGIEIPIRIYVTETGPTSAAITYRTPTSVLALYDNPELDTLGNELDTILAKIIDDAIAN